MAAVSDRRVFDGKRAVLVSAAVGLAGMGLWALGLSQNPDQAMHSYLAAFAYVASLAVGVLLFAMIGHAMNAVWVVAVRRLQEAITSAFPMLVVLFVPIALGAAYLYVWVEPPAELDEHVAHLIHHKEPYLNLPFFVARTLIFFAVCMVAAELLRRWSLRRERDARKDAGSTASSPTAATSSSTIDRERALSAALLPAVGLGVTFMAFDWLMSLDPVWFSTIFGVYYFAGGFLGGLALVTILARAAQRAGLLRKELDGSHFHALGRLLFGFVVFWSYIAFFQLMLIQIANRPEEVTFYVHRLEGSWEPISYGLIIGHFAVPFLLLLPRSIKFHKDVLTAIAIWLLVAHYIDMHWLVLPALHGHGAQPHWLDLAALAGVGGLAFAFAAWRLRGVLLVPEGDPRLARALAYRSHT